MMCRWIIFFFNDTATTEIYTLSLHDALPISYDLSQSLGIPGMVQSPLVRDKLKQVIQQAEGKKIAVGTYCDDVRTALEWRKLGVTYLAVGVDAGIFLSAAKRIAGQLKQD